MVCSHCIARVENELEKIGIQYTNVELGEINMQNDITPVQRTWLDATLQKRGYEIIDDHKNELIESLKLAIIYLENNPDTEMNPGLPDYTGKHFIENIVSAATISHNKESVTVDKYITRHKTDKVKELFVYDNLTLAEIDRKMHYTTVAQLSSQFKSITGLTPAHFRQLRLKQINNPVLN